MNWTKLALAALVIALTACGARGPKFETPQSAAGGTGQVYVYRVYEARGSAGVPNIYIDGQKRDKLKAGGYVSYSLPAGQHHIFLGSKPGDLANWSPDPVEFSFLVQSGKNYYFRMLKDDSNVGAMYMPGIGVMPVGRSKIGLASIQEEYALKELSETRLSR